MVDADAICGAAWTLRNARYRQWQPGNSIPMWLDDGVGDPPPIEHLSRVGVMGADLINYALRVNGFPAGGGTGTFANYLVNTGNFDPSTPGQRGAIALRPYQGPNDDGSIALYLDEHRIIQSIPSDGVTHDYTDWQTYQWASQGYPRYGFTIYGLLWGVNY